MVSSISSQSTSLTELQQATAKKKPSAEDMFKKLSSDLGVTDGSSITKDQLDSYISKLESSDDSSDDKGKLGFLKQLQKNFDTVAGSDGQISMDDMKNNMDALKPQHTHHGNKSGKTSATSATDALSSISSDSTDLAKLMDSSSSSSSEWLDPSEITSSQLESPISLLV